MLEIFAGQMRMSDNGYRVCANEECKTPFLPKVYNAIYCSTPCRRLVTNAKILKRYHENKEAFVKKRICPGFHRECGGILSIYNRENICESCKRERYIQRLVGWGWDEEKLRKEMSL